MIPTNSWHDFFKKAETSLYFQNIKTRVSHYENKTIYPPKDLVFNAFNLTPLDEVKVVIVGQDPYHQPDQAMGLAFSVPAGVKLPPSLVNIYKEMENDLGAKPESGDLTYLAAQGVFLFNTILTVEAGKPLSHQSKDYETFAIEVIKELARQPQPIVFVLWGNHARSLKKYINGPKKLVIEGTHPSPLGANKGGFFFTAPFSKTNKFLKANNVTPISWIK